MLDNNDKLRKQITIVKRIIVLDIDSTEIYA